MNILLDVIQSSFNQKQDQGCIQVHGTIEIMIKL